jgi:lipoyl(octanoyl) transferase
MKVLSFARKEYLQCLAEMRHFTAGRNDKTEDQIWLVEHEPVFTLGLASKPEHLLAVGNIPCVQTERGGQVTYHGPGQVIAYILLDLRRSGIMVRDLVCRMEAAIIEALGDYGLKAYRCEGAPGVYLAETTPNSPEIQIAESRYTPTQLVKIASLGIKVSRGCTYHGLALNVDMDLKPFTRINPCGFAGQKVTDVRTALEKLESEQALPPKPGDVARSLGSLLRKHLTSPY